MGAEQATVVYLGSKHGDETDPVGGAWVYWRVGDATTVLRADRDGRLWALKAGKEKTRPRDYTEGFRAEFGLSVDVYYSRGARPIPGPVLTEHKAAFFRCTVKPRPPEPDDHKWYERLIEWGEALVAPNSRNTVAIVGPAMIQVPKLTITLITPVEEGLWPLLWEIPKDQPDDKGKDWLTSSGPRHYHTAGLPQGAALWTGSHLTVHENQASPPTPDFVTCDGGKIYTQIRERGLKIAGAIDSRARKATLKIFDAHFARLSLREKLASDAKPLQEIELKLADQSDGARSFSGEAFLTKPAQQFGIVTLVVWSDINGAPHLEAFSVCLCGLQIGLADDFSHGASGTSPGTPDDLHEVVIVDFAETPEATGDELTAKTRARRMVAYDLGTGHRSIDGGSGPVVPKPQMPLWMAELAIIGVDRATLSDVMQRAYDLYAPAVVSRPRIGSSVAPSGFFRFGDHEAAPATPDSKHPPKLPPSIGIHAALNWSLRMSWEGTDTHLAAQSNVQRAGQSYSYARETLGSTSEQRVTLWFNADGVPSNKAGVALTLGAGGSVPDAFVDENEAAKDPSPAIFPISGRRTPNVVIQGKTRRWGLQGTQTRPAIIIEYQPLAVDAQGNESILGGDGLLSVDLTLSGRRVASEAWVTPPDDVAHSSAHDLVLPRFRVRGKNPSSTDVRQVISALVGAIRSRLQAASSHDLRYVAPLTDDQWGTTIERIFQHESSGMQFDHFGDAQRRTELDDVHYGHERDMPLFGPPHGYGLGQLDLVEGTRGVNDKEVWDWTENLRSAVEAVILRYGRIAYDYLASLPPGIPDPVTRRFQAVYQRELVRRYNSEHWHEFIWSDDDWRVSPSAHKWKKEAHHAKGPYENVLYPNQVLQTQLAYWMYFANATVPAPGAPSPPPGAGSANVLVKGGVLTDALADAQFNFSWPVTFKPSDYGPGI